MKPGWNFSTKVSQLPSFSFFFSDDAVRKRKSKWDVTSSGTAALTIPPSAVQTIASVQAVVAAASSKLVAVQVKKP